MADAGPAIEVKGLRKSFSLTGQFAAVDHLLTGRENLVLIGELRHVTNPVRTAESLLEQFDLTEAADQRTLTYSGGMRRKLDIALGLVGDPAIIFLDEPTTGLDPESRNTTWDTIKSLADSGKSILLTTQYLDEADRLADKIAIISHGRIAAEGTPQALKSVLAHGQIELRFADATQLAEAGRVLADRQPSRSESALSLTISTDGSVAQVSRLFSLLERAKIEVAEFAQKLVGFRSRAAVVELLLFVTLTALFILATTWLAIMFGLLAKTVEGAGSFSYILLLMVFVSPGFAPTGSMSAPVRAFAKHQPMTPIVNTMRSLLIYSHIGNSAWAAFAWCGGLLAVCYVAALRFFQTRRGPMIV